MTEVYASQDGKALLVDTAIGAVKRTPAPFPDELDEDALWKPARPDRGAGPPPEPPPDAAP